MKSTQHWQADQIGVAMAVAGLCSVLCQTPAGAIVDSLRNKRVIVIVAAVAVSLACLSYPIFTSFYAIIAAQIVVGCSGAFFAPAIAAITLGMVGRGALDKRMGRNEAFNHAGNVLAACLIAGVAYLAGPASIFPVVALMGVGAICSAWRIRSEDIDYEQARGGEGAGHKPVSVIELLRTPHLFIFALCVILFHFANAALLPQVGQKVSESKLANASVCMSACIVVAQLVMVPTAIIVSRLASRGRKKLFLVAFLTLPVRAILFCLSADPLFLISVQILDGIGAGIFGVIGVLMAADLTRGTGRFNLTQGLLATGVGLGAALSNLLTGFIVSKTGYNAGFFVLAFVAAVASAIFAIFMPETLNIADRAGNDD